MKVGKHDDGAKFLVRLFDDDAPNLKKFTRSKMEVS